MYHNMNITYFYLPHFHISNDDSCFEKYSITLLLHRRSLLTSYQHFDASWSRGISHDYYCPISKRGVVTWQRWECAGIVVLLLTTRWQVQMNDEISYRVYCSLWPFYQRRLNLIPAWISDYIHHKVCGEITFSFPKFSGTTVNVWEWISNFNRIFF